MSELKAYTEEELAEHQQLYDEVFAPVWESEGQYCRSGGGQYEKSFAWWAFKHQQSKIDKLQANFDQHDQWLGQRNRDVQELNDIIAKHAAEKDELQKGNDALVHVIKSRDIQLENEKHEYDELMNKLVDSGMKNAEMQKQNAWLSGVAERENKRANNLQQDKTSTTILLGKTIQEKNDLTKQRDSFIKAYEIEIEIDKSDDLQKRVDLTLQLVNEMKGKRYPFSAYADQLEQALKGDSNG